ncbi:MAG: hypothetical protein JNL51_14865 [Chitinophagaceae bacterium]|nr:hypothetical protein [Chitinophagaceae bacterium]
MRYKQPILVFCLALSYCDVVTGQEDPNSIYSAYGIGDYRMRDQNAYMGMGNVGVAMPSTYSINEINPSSFAWLPKDNLKLELTLGGLSSRYINENVNAAAGDFTISRVALSAQFIGAVRTIVGLRRLSQVQYYTTASRGIAGTETNTTNDVEGNGGLYQIYTGNAIRIGKNLAVGANIGFIFGSINTKESMALNNGMTIVSDANKYYHQASLGGGVQYQISGEKNKWILGAFYEPQIKLNVEEEAKLLNQSDEILSEKNNAYGKFLFPQKFGVGISLSRNSFTGSIDMIGHLWSATKYKGNHFTATDAYSFSAGIRHQFTRTTYWGQTPGISLHAGFNREQSYLVINNNQIVSNAATIGATFPSKNNLNFYSVGCKIGSRGIAVYPLIKENFFEFNFNFSLGGFLYKDKKYD